MASLGARVEGQHAAMDDDDQWWYCLRHKGVEHGLGCANTYRMGPYASRAEAESALEVAAARTQSWDEDPRWKDDEDDQR